MISAALLSRKLPTKLTRTLPGRVPQQSWQSSILEGPMTLSVSGISLEWLQSLIELQFTHTDRALDWLVGLPWLADVHANVYKPVLPWHIIVSRRDSRQWSSG